ncbi:tRNA (adenosine(37)-N6)-dimethylallyltransferase MiaA [Paenalkalicoccus suaedae]|uniref:tRNA dimethylallyltransferase n=1 Tax=Paenalkalicoccus suaedae TaxID=2592382 RepID=A0A859FGK8_9BACI|nr:tRNA (adenosine(37)-N6)-dimethylallyltransferase MiaA [Paenalkalicoccus suaedae]QKS71356.1 tRNA (adenosine(37)-N6)-dimethylallyltransferase MiaA [Paenalkalicoccus suaedae]
MKPKLIVIIGPTAVGKTETSIRLAKHFNGEVISGDSMQVYKEMDIGTAKIKPEETAGVPHHLIDVLTPDESYSAADFRTQATELIEDIVSRGKVPMIVGGTGMYIQGLLYNYQFSEIGEDESVRQKYEAYEAEHGSEALHKLLASKDADRAATIHPNNIRKVIRALEIIELTGEKIDQSAEELKESPFDFILIGLTMEREALYTRINERCELMMREGLLKEATRLYESGYENAQSMQAIGYKELLPAIRGEEDIKTSLEELKKQSRRFAKRQLTWFRNKMPVTWFDMSHSRDERIKEMIEFIEGKWA